MQRIGTVRRVHRYPVKSFRGERLSSARILSHGLEFDRIYAFVDPRESPAFPWLTGRKVPEMILFTPSLADSGADPIAIDVLTPEGERRRLTEPEFLADLKKRWGCEFELRYDPAGMHDSRPISIFGTATLEQIAEQTSLALDPHRFRMNLLVDFEGRDAFYEDTLVGSTLRIGEQVTLRVDKKNRRCVMINLEPATADKAPEVLRNVGKERQGYAGVYAVPEQVGVVTEGDAVYLV